MCYKNCNKFVTLHLHISRQVLIKNFGYINEHAGFVKLTYFLCHILYYQTSNGSVSSVTKEGMT